MNRDSILGEALLEFARRSHGRGVSHDREVRRSRSEPSDLLEIIGLVGRDAHDAVGAEGVMERPEKGLVDQAARRVAALRPRVGKHEVEYRNGIRRQQPLDRVRNFDPQNARIRQARALDFAARSPDASQQALDSQKIPVRISGRDGGEKRSIARTEIDFDRRAAAKNGREVENLEQIRGDELGLACYG